MSRSWLSAVAAIACALPAGGLAQPAPMKARPACAAVNDAGLPAGWAGRADLAAAATLADAARSALPLGKGVNGQLKTAVTYPIAPGRPGAPGTFGGLFEIRAASAGDYKISLGAPAWIEVAGGQALLAPTSHEPGPECSTLRKTVTYTLQPGRYLLEIAGNAEPTLAVMVTKVR